MQILSPTDGFSAQARVTGVVDFKLQGLVWSQFHTSASSIAHPVADDSDDEGENKQPKKQPSQVSQGWREGEALEEEAGRLFGISLKGFLFEVDLATGNLINVQDTFGGAAWSIASSPRSNLIAVGGEDGSVRLFRYYGGNKLDYVKSLPTSGSRVLSLAFHPNPGRPHLFMGCSDGTIRCIEEESGRVLFRMTGDVHPGVFTPAMWTMTVLSDSTVITGDSRGQVQIWDGNVGVLSGSFAQHAADVLTVISSPDENRVFASGIDGKVICIQRSGHDDANRHHWVYTHSQRTHTHDVFALAIVAKPSTGIASSYPGKNHTLLSGGLDTRISMYSVEDFDRIRPIWMPIIPANELISAACIGNNSGRVVLRHRSHVDIWHIDYAKTENDSNTTESVPSSSGVTVIAGNKGDLDEQCTLLLRLKAAGSEHIQCATLSPNGKILLISTQSETKAWRIHYNYTGSNVNSNNVIKLIKLKFPENVSSRTKPGVGVSMRDIVFSPNGSLFAAWHATKKAILLFSIDQSNHDDDGDEENVDIFKFLAAIPYDPTPPTTPGTEIGNSPTTATTVVDKKLCNFVRRIVFSDDSEYLAISNAVNEVMMIHVNKRVKHWSLPALPGNIADIQFLPTSTHSNVSSNTSGVPTTTPGKKGKKGGKTKEVAAVPTTTPTDVAHNLVILLSTNAIIVCECDKRVLHPWSTQNDEKKRRSIPHELRFPLAGIAVDPKHSNRFFVYGQLHSIYIDLLQDMPEYPKIIAPSYALTSSTTVLDSKGQLVKAENEQEKHVSFSAETKNSKRKRDDEIHSDDEDYPKLSSTSASNVVRSTSSNGALIETYRNILYLGWLNNSSGNSLVSNYCIIYVLD